MNKLLTKSTNVIVSLSLMLGICFSADFMPASAMGANNFYGSKVPVSNAADANTITLGGHTWIEEYINGFSPAQSQVAAVSGNVYYVSVNGSDTNPGTEAAPWRTIQKAVDSVGPGDTIFVRAGTYNESVAISRSGSAEGVIKLTSYPGEVAEINGGSNRAMYSRGAVGYWTIEGLRFSSTNQLALRLGWYHEAVTHHITLRKNYINGAVFTVGNNQLFEDNEMSGIGYTASGGYGGLNESQGGMGDDATHHNVYRRNYIHDFTNYNARGIWTQGRTHDNIFEFNRVENVWTSGIGQCIDLDAGSDNLVQWRHIVRNNTVKDCKYVGIQLENVFDTLVENNLVKAERGGSAGVIVINYSPTVGCGVGGENNQYGDTNGDNSCKGDITNNIIRQNVITKKGSWGWGYGGLVNWGAGGVKIIGNTFYASSASGNGAINFQAPADQTSQSVIQNNIIYNAGGPAICALGFESFIEDGNNLLYRASSDRVYANGESCREGLSLAAYQSATGKGQNSLDADPQFVSLENYDFHLNSTSPAIDRGAAIGVTTDFDGAARPQGNAFDIGAYETNGTAPTPVPTITSPTVIPTNTPEPTFTPTPIPPTNTPEPTFTPTPLPPTNTPEPTFTPTPIPPTNTPEPTFTPTPLPPTNTPEPTFTPTPIPPTNTPEPTFTSTPIPPTFTEIFTPTPTATYILPTNSVEPTFTATLIPPTNIPELTFTATSIPPTNTPEPTFTPTPIPPTNTPEPTFTPTLVPPTNTPEPTFTPTSIPPTNTPEPTFTPTLVPPTNTPEPTFTPTLIPPTNTPEPTFTPTPIPPTNTPEPTMTPTPVLQASETIYDDRDSAFVYSAGWEDKEKSDAYKGTLKLTKTKDSSVTFPFTGQSFSILYRGGSNYGKMLVYVDGVQVDTLDQKLPRYESQKRWDYAGQLVPGNHVLKLIFVNYKYAYGSLDAIIVRNSTAPANAVTPTLPPTSIPPTVQPATETVYDDKDSAITYSDGWMDVKKTQAYGGSFKLATHKDVQASLVFTGQSFGILYTGGPNFRKIDVYIDDVLVGTVNEKSAKPSFQSRWNYTGSLTPGPHTLRLVFAPSGKYSKTSGSIDAIIVRQ